MLIEVLECLEPLSPMESFRVQGRISYAKTEEMTLRRMKKREPLADLSFLFGSPSVAKVALAWNEKGLCVYVNVDKPITKVDYPHFAEGDAFELLIDTRDLKESRFFHPFCHRFVFLPKEVRGIVAQEISIFRKEEGHPLCDPRERSVETQGSKNSYEMLVKIAAPALYGFDPDAFTQLGLSYRVYQESGPSQSFSSNNQHFSLEQQPRFWASFSLEKMET